MDDSRQNWHGNFKVRKKVEKIFEPTYIWTRKFCEKNLKFSNPATFLEGSYCDSILAKKILRFFVTREKVFLPVHWKKLNLILPFFELEYIQKNIKECKEPYFMKNRKITNESYRHTALGKVEIFPIQKSIPKLLKFTFKINFYDPIEYLNISFPNFLDNRGMPLFVNKNEKNHFFKILDEKNI